MSNKEIKEQILNKIKEYDKIVLIRHVRPDGDAVGSTLGLRALIRATWPEKQVLSVNSDKSEYVGFLGEDDAAPSDDFYASALVIAIDTANVGRLANDKYTLAKELIKIDHHVDIEPFGDIFWVEDYRSSACEMIADFYITFKSELKMTEEAATCIYTGMVTDSGRFRYDGTTGETLRCAAALLDYGIDTETIFARLYLDDYDYLKFQSYVLGKMKMTENGVAYLIVDKKMQEKFSLTPEQASNTVSLISEIKGCIVWIAFIEYDDLIRVRLRSRFVTINKLAEQYHGGGHACASGATVYSRKELKKLLADADKLVHDFKENNFYL